MSYIYSNTAVNDPNGEENRITTKEILHHFVVKNIELKIHIPNLPETSRSDKADSSSKEEEDEKKEEDEKADLYIFKYCHSEIEDVQKSHTKGINAAKKWLRESTNEVKKKYWELHSAKNKTNVERNSAHFEVIFFFLKMCRILFERAGNPDFVYKMTFHLFYLLLCQHHAAFIKNNLFQMT